MRSTFSKFRSELKLLQLFIPFNKGRPPLRRTSTKNTNFGKIDVYLFKIYVQIILKASSTSLFKKIIFFTDNKSELFYNLQKLTCTHLHVGSQEIRTEQWMKICETNNRLTFHFGLGGQSKKIINMKNEKCDPFAYYDQSKSSNGKVPQCSKFLKTIPKSEWAQQNQYI